MVRLAALGWLQVQQRVHTSGQLKLGSAAAETLPQGARALSPCRAGPQDASRAGQLWQRAARGVSARRQKRQDNTRRFCMSRARHMVCSNISLPIAVIATITNIVRRIVWRDIFAETADAALVERLSAALKTLCLMRAPRLRSCFLVP